MNRVITCVLVTRCLLLAFFLLARCCTMSDRELYKSQEFIPVGFGNRGNVTWGIVGIGGIALGSRMHEANCRIDCGRST
jgi:hypothetical protein